MKHESPISATADPIVEQTGFPGKVSSRLLSLDAMRGATILLMVLVNNAGGPVSYSALKHSDWHGWTLTDTVFPTFLWIVGVSITLSLGKKLESGERPAALLPKIVRRSILLFVLGLSVYGYPEFSISHQRLLGVLQRIAICYLAASLIFVYTSLRSQIAWIVGLFAAYWLMMTCINVPGYGYGRLDVEGNFAHYIDWVVLGTHNYAASKTWDPEGLVSTLPAIGTTLLGILAGHILRLPGTLGRRRAWLGLVGLALVAAGLLCSIWLPINKKLWTDSFALFMAGLDFVTLAFFVWFVDERRLRKPVKPFLIVGVNAIAVYLASEFLAEILDAVHVRSGSARVSLAQFAYTHVFAPLTSPINASLLYACMFTALMYLLAYAMYKRHWFLRL